MQEFEQEYGEPPKYNFGEMQNTAELIRYLDPNLQKQKLLIQLFGLEWNEKTQLCVSLTATKKRKTDF